MTLMTRTAILQARVRPEIKYASEQVLQRIGLTMTEAMELFLRRIIVDEKLPFEVTALDDATLATIIGTWRAGKQSKEPIIELEGRGSKKRKHQRRE
ncbi:MAG: type II toxin-antitoxin system RelB/DinJ family antitoxin [Patescibacteria group bacterium]|nr:type II toxin-antitoxin system RelB/DinJ family antitoxin [Patescibacteria group bacterium]